MSCRNRCGKLNVKVLIVLILVVLAVGMSLVAARQIRRDILSKMSLEAGEAAFAKKDWPAAYVNYQEYLGRNQDDVEILKKYAKARLSIRPLESTHIAGAISAYRRVMQLDPRDQTASEELAMLYTATGNLAELSYIAQTRLQYDPNDLKAPLWLADALVRLNKTPEARQTLANFIGQLEKSPDKRPEYVRACVGVSQIALLGVSSTAREEALTWLNRAVDYAVNRGVNPAEALVHRAQLYRAASGSPDASETARLGLLRSAKEDLEAIDAQGTEDPRIRCFLSMEWMAHGELDKAAAELKAADSLPQETLEKHFFDIEGWTAGRFLLASELALRKGDAAGGAALADEVLAALKERRHRIQVLPVAIPVYVASGKVAEARRCLNEYLDVLRTQETTVLPRVKIAYLQALVAKAEGNWYAVIDVLQPVVVTETSQPDLWRLLSEAFSRTDQSRRAVSTLIRYLRLRPGDAEMTLQLAKEYLRLRDWNRALDTARLAEPLDPADFLIKLLRIEASVHVVAGQQQKVNPAAFDQLLKELDQLRAEHPDQVDIRILQAIVAVYREEPEKAEKELTLAIEECKEPLRAEMQLVGHYYRLKRLDEATRVCEEACKRHAQVAEPWLYMASLDVGKGDYDSARSTLRQGLAAAVDKWEKRSLSIQLAVLEATHGDRADAVKILSELAAQDPYEIRARTMLLGIPEVRQDRPRAEGLIKELRLAEGESGLWWRLHQAALCLSSEEWRSKQQDVTDYLRYCIDSDPEWSAPTLLLADMYERLNDSRRVEDICRQALARSPSATDIADKLVTLLEKQGRFADAEAVLRQTEADPRTVSAWQVRTALREGEFSRAIDELKLRVSNDDRDVNSRLLLARLIYWQTSDAGQALDYVQQAETIAPGTLAVTAVKAAILKAAGKTEEAQKILNDYVVSRNDFAAYLMRGAYLANAGQLERAEEDYKKLTTFAEKGTAGYELLSNFYVSGRQFDQAVAALEDGLKAYPEDPVLERRLMRLLFVRAQGQDRDRAVGILAELEKRSPGDPELMKMRALLMLENPTPESIKVARETLENVVKLEPTALDAHRALIGAAMRERDYRMARDYAIRALGSNRNNHALLLARGRAELELENTQMAVEMARLVLREDPNSIEAIDVIVQASRKNEDRRLREEARTGVKSERDFRLLDEARTLIESGVNRNPKNEQLVLSRARILVSLGQPKAAIPAMETYCQTQEGSSSVAAFVTLADLYRLAGDMEQAGQKIDQARQLDPASQAVAHARLLWLVAQKRVDELAGISSAYISAKEQNPAMILTAASVLTAANSAKLKEEGVKLFEHAVAQFPTLVDARLGLASVQYQMGAVERAKGIYQDLLKQDPDDVRVLNDLAWILQEHDHDYKAALELADKGLRLLPADVHLLDTRGTILSNMPDRLADAKNDFESLVNLSPGRTREKAKALLRLGRVCSQLNDPAQAKQHLQAALDIDRDVNVFTEAERTEISKIIQQGGR